MCRKSWPPTFFRCKKTSQKTNYACMCVRREIFIFVAGKPLHSISQFDCKTTFLHRLSAKSLQFSAGSTNRSLTSSLRIREIVSCRGDDRRPPLHPTRSPNPTSQCQSSTWFSFREKHQIKWRFVPFFFFFHRPPKLIHYNSYNAAQISLRPARSLSVLDFGKTSGACSHYNLP